MKVHLVNNIFRDLQIVVNEEKVPKGEVNGGGREGQVGRERERSVIAVPLCGQIKFKRMTRTLVSRMEQWPFEHTSLEDLSRRLLTLRCTVDGTMENCAAAAAAAVATAAK